MLQILNCVYVVHLKPRLFNAIRKYERKIDINASKYGRCKLVLKSREEVRNKGIKPKNGLLSSF